MTRKINWGNIFNGIFTATQVSRLEEALNSLENDINRNFLNNQSRTIAVANRVSNNEAWIASHNTWAGDQKNRIDNVADRIGTAEAWISTHNTWSGQQKTRIDNLAADITRHAGVINSNTSNIEAFRTTINSLSSRAKALETWKADHNTWSGQQKTRIDNLSADVTRHAGVINTNTKNIENHRTAINSLSSRAVALETWKAEHNTWAGEQKTRIDNLSADVTRHAGVINTNTKNIENHRTAINSLSSRAVALETWKEEHNKWAGEQKVRIDNLSADVTRHAGVINTNTKNIEGHRTAINSLSSRAAALETWKETHNTWAGEQKARIDTLSTNVTNNRNDITKLKAFEVAQALWNTNQSSRITNLEDKHKVKNLSDVSIRDITQTGLYKLNSNITDTPTATNTYIMLEVKNFNGALIQKIYREDRTHYIYQRVRHANGTLWQPWKRITNEDDIQALEAKNVELANLLKSESTDRKAADTAINGKLTTINQAINALNAKVDGLNWSDLGIIAAVRESMKANTDLWTAEHYDGSVGVNDGKAVRLFKNQFQSLKAHTAGILKFYFDMNDPNSAIYKLRYSIVAGAEEIRQLLAEQLPMIMDRQSAANVYLDAISTWLEAQDKHFKTLHSDLSTVIQWLKAIFDKPGPVVSVPAFDYARLEEMLKKISFGNITNEAGENIWSVLKELIKQVGEIIKTGLKELSDTAQAILDFLDGLLDELIRLVVPENLDFINAKFDGTANTVKMKFPFVFGWVDTFKSFFGNQSAIEDQEFSLNGMFEGNVVLPFSIINQFAPIIRPIATGFLLLGFLIDMYKWFHTKGEVVE